MDTLENYAAKRGIPPRDLLPFTRAYNYRIQSAARVDRSGFLWLPAKFNWAVDTLPDGPLIDVRPAKLAKLVGCSERTAYRWVSQADKYQIVEGKLYAKHSEIG